MYWKYKDQFTIIEGNFLLSRKEMLMIFLFKKKPTLLISTYSNQMIEDMVKRSFSSPVTPLRPFLMVPGFRPDMRIV